MRYRKLDSNGDMVFGTNGQDYYVDNPQAVAQAVLTTLRLVQGEWFLDTRAGVPWFTKVTGYNTRSFYDAVIQQAILDVPNVTEITSYSSSVEPTTRKLQVAVVLNTVFGSVVVPVVSVHIGNATGFGIGGFGEGGFGGA